MKIIKINSEFFNIEDTLFCGQLFRFYKFDKGFTVVSEDKCAYLYYEGDNTVIECNDLDYDYFYDYFDLDRDYSLIYNLAQKDCEILKKASLGGKGIRILNQDPEETLFSFIVSQNNNIPRIKKIIEELAQSIGEKKELNGFTFYSFPTAKKMSSKDVDFFKKCGLGYRAEYIKALSDNIVKGFDVKGLTKFDTKSLKEELLKIYGVGPKVRDCVSLFGFHRTDSFPVDTWIEKVYKENFGGLLSNREKIAEWFVERFKENSGYFQQYLFYYKRSLEKK